jgi:uncharacterized SAM-binding protein YcdF (DUF218 family)
MYALIVRLTNPFLVLLLISGIVIALRWRRREHRSRWLGCLTAMYLVLYVYCLPITAYGICGSLEWQYHFLIGRPPATRAIIVLGGGVISPHRDGDPTQLAEGSLLRCQRVAELYHAGAPCRVFVVGGNPDGTAGDDVSKVMARTLERMGVAPRDLIVETASRNTEENATAAAEMLAPEDVGRPLLVTTAMHLPRAVRLFRRRGIDVIPAGCQYRTDEFEFGVFSFLPSARMASNNNEAAHEWLGSFWLMLRGKW